MFLDFEFNDPIFTSSGMRRNERLKKENEAVTIVLGNEELPKILLVPFIPILKTASPSLLDPQFEQRMFLFFDAEVFTSNVHHEDDNNTH